MDEAHALCDRVAVIDRGKVIALGTPDELCERHGATTRVRFSAPRDLELDDLRTLDAVDDLSRDGEAVTISGGKELLVRVVVALHERDFTPTDLRVDAVTLEDAFLELTGRTMRD